MRPLLLLLALGCARAPQAPMPDGFGWGSATAGFQVEPGCPTLPDAACEDRASDWYQFVTDPRTVNKNNLHISGEPLSAGPGLWETFEADADLMRADGFTHHRLSLEWSRLFPDPATAAATTVEQLDALVDPAADARYREMLQALRDRGIAPVVTLNHYTLPQWVHDGAACHVDLETCGARGWVDRDILPRIALYAAWCARRYGDLVDLWFTQNEPVANVLAGYLLPGEARSHPPGLTFATDAAIAVFLHQIEAHALMYDAVHAHDPSAEVGVVLNFVAFHLDRPDEPADARAVENLEYLYHSVWLDAVTTGAWDPDLDGDVDETRPDLAGRLDVIGVNFYNRIAARGTPRPLIPGFELSNFFFEVTWDPYPAGLGEVTAALVRYDLPIWVTENGTPFVEDRGTQILGGHLRALRAAMVDDGADVRGYLYWSQIDNYEWNHGMDMRFGLYALEPDKSRRERALLGPLREVIRRNALDPLDP